MVEVTLRLPGEAKKRVLEALKEELAELEGKAARLKEELRAYEEKYGLSSQEFARLWSKAVKHEEPLPLPEEADLDLVEWKALYELYTGLLSDIEEIRESVRRLRGP